MKTQKLLLLLQWLRPHLIRCLMWMKAQWIMLSTQRWRREMDRAQASLDRRIERLKKRTDKTHKQ